MKSAEASRNLKHNQYDAFGAYGCFGDASEINSVTSSDWSTIVYKTNQPTKATKGVTAKTRITKFSRTLVADYWP